MEISPIEDINNLILDFLDDYSLSQICSTKTAPAVCNTPKIQKRLKDYQECKDYKVLDDMWDLDAKEVERPYILHTSKIGKSLVEFTFYIFDDNLVDIIRLRGSWINKIGRLNITIPQIQGRYTIQDYMEQRLTYDLDIDTIYQLYTKKCNLHAKEATITYLKSQLRKCKALTSVSFSTYYQLLGWYYWFRLNVNYLDLVHADIEPTSIEMNIDYVTNESITELKKGITGYCYLLVDYIINL